MEYPKSDGWQRPVVKPEAGGPAKAMTRVTTVAKTLDDMNGLMKWHGSMVAGGAILKPDVLARIAARWPYTDDSKAEIGRLSEELKDAGGGSVGKNMGDAAHEMIKRINLGERFAPLPPYDGEVKAYRAIMEEYGIEVDPRWVERTVVLPDLGVAGSFDLLVRRNGSGLIVADVKTTKDLNRSWLSICVQLALYSRAKTVYDWDSETHEPMPAVDQRIGLIIHLPVGTGRAALHVVDLVAGWEAAQLAMAVREWRKRKDLARPARLNGAS